MSIQDQVDRHIGAQEPKFASFEVNVLPIKDNQEQAIRRRTQIAVNQNRACIQRPVIIKASSAGHQTRTANCSPWGLASSIFGSRQDSSEEIP